MNKCIFVTRLTRDPEIRYSQAETSMVIAKFSGAVDRRIKKQGEQDTDFLNFVAFGKTAEFIDKYCKKGTKLIVESHVQTGNYTNKEGVKIYTTDFVIDQVEFAESKKSDLGSEKANGSEDFMNIEDGGDDYLPFQ